MEDYQKGYGFRVHNQTAYVEMIYPRSPGHVNAVEVDMQCVRAADSIRIAYDFERDGYSIMQASRFEWDADDTVCDPGWQEVAFVQAWAREEAPTA
jgi:hypothetical protein